MSNAIIFSSFSFYFSVGLEDLTASITGVCFELTFQKIT